MLFPYVTGLDSTDWVMVNLVVVVFACLATGALSLVFLFSTNTNLRTRNAADKEIGRVAVNTSILFVAFLLLGIATAVGVGVTIFVASLVKLYRVVKMLRED